MATFLINDNKLTFVERLAVKELKRYWYIMKNEQLESAMFNESDGNYFVIAHKDSKIIKENGDLISDDNIGSGYTISSGKYGGNNIIALLGNTDIDVLYAVYRFVEYMGVGFGLHGDIFPDTANDFNPFSTKLNIVDEPLFETRGILPFHDFPEGPDWWDKDDYYSVLTQLVKLRGNFIGLHTYPEPKQKNQQYIAEPTVWLGKENQMDSDGNVNVSYPAQHFKTTGGSWGYNNVRTSDYPFEMGKLFDREVYCASYMHEYEDDDYYSDMKCDDLSLSKYNAVFNKYGDFLNEIFQYAKKLGIKTCLGTETPLVIPKRIEKNDTLNDEERYEFYKGIFKRIERKYPLDYYWLWTPEDWTWRGNTLNQTTKTVNDVKCAIKAKEANNSNFELALCGWTLGPKEDRAYFDNCFPANITFSCINRNVGFDPIEAQFDSITKRSKWAIPWMEDDPALTSIQLWAGRMRRDAYDAKRYGCEGLIGIHWRVKAIAPNVKALMNAAWRQNIWDKDLSEDIQLEGLEGKDSKIELIPNKEGIYSSARSGVELYHLIVPAGEYCVTLYFIDVDSKRRGERVFDVDVNMQSVKNFDIFERSANSPCELVLDKVIVHQDVTLDIKMNARVGKTIISGISIIGKTLNGQSTEYDFERNINIGGNKFKEFEADLEELDGFDRNAPTEDFYIDWSNVEFGCEVSEKISRIFTKIDGKLPRPTSWVNGPGNVYKNSLEWERVKKEYEFIDDFIELEDMIVGKGCVSRFNYWKYQFLSLKECARIGCLWGAFDKAYENKNDEKLIRIYKKLYSSIYELEQYLLNTVETIGDIGVVTNMQQRTIMPLLDHLRAVLEERDIDFSIVKSLDFACKVNKLVVPTVRTSLQKNEDFVLKIIVIGGCDERPVLSWKKIGDSSYKNIYFKHCKGWVYCAKIEKEDIKYDFEYHISVGANNNKLYFPQSDLHKEQTVIVI